MNKKTFHLTLGCIFGVSLLNVLFNYQIKFITDSLLAQNSTLFQQHIWQLLLIMSTMLFMEWVRQVANTRFLNQAGYHIHQTILGRLMHSRTTLKQSEVGDTLSKITNDIEMVKELHYDTIFSLFQGVVSFGISAIALLTLNRTTALFILAVSVAPIIVPALFKNQRRQLQQQLSASKSTYTTHLQDVLQHLLPIKNYGKQTFFEQKMNHAYQDMNHIANRRGTIVALVNVLTGCCFYLTIVVILFVGGQQVLAQQMTIGALTSLYSISLELTLPVTLISDSLSSIHSVQDLLRELRAPLPKKSAYQGNTEPFEQLSIQQLTHAFDSKSVLKDVSLTFERGKKYLITGESGIGKSTLAYFLTQQYETKADCIFLNRRAFKHYSYETIQSYITFISQHDSLLQESIWDNLTLHTPMNPETVLYWIRQFQLDERFPTVQSLKAEFYDSHSALSGGQKQRLLLIRALLHRKPVLILDESLAALDEATFDLVEQSLLSQKDLTLIHISHRRTRNPYDEIIELK
ncbi:MAG: ABC transporter ATP-binding protein [Aerococcaceae bacterium]|nr:ABC transporter ATP-binding protein [Aerococcaceae bacterium]